MRKISFFGIVMVLLLSMVGCSKQTELSTDVLPTKVTVMGYVRYITLNKNLQSEEPELVDKGHQVNIFYGVPNDKGNVDGYALKTVTVDNNAFFKVELGCPVGKTLKVRVGGKLPTTATSKWIPLRLLPLIQSNRSFSSNFSFVKLKLNESQTFS